MGPPASHSSVKTRDQGLGTRDQGPRDQGTRDQGTRDQGTRGPGDQGTRGPGDQGTRGPGDQGTRGPEQSIAAIGGVSRKMFHSFHPYSTLSQNRKLLLRPSSYSLSP